MNDKKLKVLLGTGLLLVILLLVINSFGDIKYSSSEGLTYGEKKSDAKYLMDFLEKTYPYFDEIKADSGQDLIKEKEKLIDTIAKTSTDGEFYTKTSEMLRKFTYGYAEINMYVDPNINNYIYLDKKYGLTRDKYFEKLLKENAKWEPIQQEYWNQFTNTQYISNMNALYINGKYYITMSQDPNVHVGDEVVKVNGSSVEDFAKTLPRDKYFLTYDYNLEKLVVTSLFTFKDNLPKEITIKNSTGAQREVELLTFDPKKPILENGFKAFVNGQSINLADNIQGNFLNTFEENKILALNFTAYVEAYKYLESPQDLAKLFTKISESDYLILDLRRSINEPLLKDILAFVSPKDLEYLDYKVLKKNEINDDFINHYKSAIQPFAAEVTGMKSSLEKVYPEAKYHIFEEKTVDIKGRNKYKGKVFIFFDTTFSSDESNQILKTIIDQNIATVISNGKFPLINYIPNYLTTSVILPNSNMAITVQNGKVVDENGTFIGKILVTPQVIIKQDTSKIIEKLKGGNGYILEISEEDRYTSKDEYFNEVLKLVK